MNNIIFVNFGIAAFAYYLFSELVKALIKDEPAQKIFLIVLLFICISIAILGYFFLHI